MELPGSPSSSGVAAAAKDANDPPQGYQDRRHLLELLLRLLQTSILTVYA